MLLRVLYIIALENQLRLHAMEFAKYFSRLTSIELCKMKPRNRKIWQQQLEGNFPLSHRGSNKLEIIQITISVALFFYPISACIPFTHFTSFTTFFIIINIDSSSPLCQQQPCGMFCCLFTHIYGYTLSTRMRPPKKVSNLLV